MNRAILAQQLNNLGSSEAVSDYVRSMARIGRGVPADVFRRQAAVGFRPVITTLPEGANMGATAIISADRRYVRISPTPLFSNVGDVTTFNFSGGGAAGGGGGGAGGGGLPGGAGGIGGFGGQGGGGGGGFF